MAVDLSQVFCADFDLIGNQAAFDASITYQAYAPCPGRAYVIVNMTKWSEIKAALDSTASGSTPPVADSASSVFSASEIQALKYQAANPSPFNLSIADGALISVSIAGVWVIAWGFKTLAHMFSGDSSE